MHVTLYAYAYGLDREGGSFELGSISDDQDHDADSSLFDALRRYAVDETVITWLDRQRKHPDFWLSKLSAEARDEHGRVRMRITLD